MRQVSKDMCHAITIFHVLVSFTIVVTFRIEGRLRREVFLDCLSCCWKYSPSIHTSLFSSLSQLLTKTPINIQGTPVTESKN